jgi:hypothetical protein
VVAAVKDEEEIMDNIEEGGITTEKASDRWRRHDRRKS